MNTTAPPKDDMKPDSITLARGAGINFAGQIFMAATVFVANIGLARLLGTYYFGLFHIGWTILRVSRLVSGLGLERGMIRFGSQYFPDNRERLNEVIWKTWGMTFISSLFFGSALFFLAPVLAEQVFNKPGLTPILRVFSLVLVIINGLRITAASTRITRKMQYHALTRMILQPGFNVLMIFILLYLFELKLTGALIAILLSYSIALLVSLVQVKRLFPGILSLKNKWNLVSKEILLFSLVSSMSGLILKIQSWLDRLFIGHYMPAGEAGTYVAASQLGHLFAIIMVTFNSIFSPMASRLFHNGNLKRLENLYRVSTKWGLYLTICLFFVVISNPETIITMAFGDSYARATSTMSILVVAHLIRAFPGAVGMLLIMTGNQVRWFIITIVTVAVNVLSNMFLIPRFGIEGAAIATVFSVIVLFASGLWQVKVVLNMWPFDRRYLKGLTAALVTGVVAFAWKTFSPLGDLQTLLISILLVSIIFWAMIIRLGLDEEDRELIWFVRRKLSGKTGVQI